jgi:hypothetical protein
VSSKDNPDAGVGRELWQVKGSVSGIVATALKTGTPINTDRFSLTIPTKLPDGFGVQRGRFSQTAISYQSRDTTKGEIEPPICIKKSLALGPEAVDQTLTLTYKARPVDGGCNCEGISVPDLSGKKCLTGKFDLTTNGETTMTPAQLSRLSRLGAWYRDVVASNTTINSDGELRSAKFDIELFTKARDAFEDCLTDIYGNQGTLHFSAWTPNTVVVQYDMIEINGKVLMAKNDGTTGATMPVLTYASIGDTTSDNNVTWEFITPIAEFLWDNALANLKIDAQVLAALSTDTLVPGTVLSPGATVAAGDIVRISGNSTRYKMLEGGTFDGTSVVVDGNIDGHPGEIINLISYNGNTRFLAVTLDDPESTSSAGDIDAPGYKSGGITGAVDDFVNRYKSSMDAVRAAAGITKKADASNVAGDGCWRDIGDAYWWEITGSVGGEYAPAFNNTPYFSSRCTCSRKYFSTHEFAFEINVKCPEKLKDGDKITLSIGDAGWPSTYQVGDTLYLPVIAAQDLYLAGGKDGDNIQTWHVDGSVTGALPPYLLDLDSPLPYNHSGLQLQINPGGIPFEAGDTFRFTVEGGHYRWRKDAGAWSASAAIPDSAVALSDGLSATFATGASPSFSAGDLYSFRALQPFALSNAVNPDVESWKWSGATATMTANLGGVKTIDCAALSFHTLPPGATVTLYGGADGVTWDWSEPITWRAGVMAKLFTAHAATFIKFEIANATGGAIGWAWSGQALSTEYSAECLLRRDYSVERGSGLNPSAAFLGSTRSGEIEWQQGILTDTDLPGLMSMLDHLKTNDDEPMILIPQSTRPEEAYPVRVLIDSVDMPEDGGYQPNSGNDRRYGLKLSLKGVVA